VEAAGHSGQQGSERHAQRGHTVHHGEEKEQINSSKKLRDSFCTFFYIKSLDQLNKSRLTFKKKEKIIPF
jgi:hypothetical protein